MRGGSVREMSWGAFSVVRAESIRSYLFPFLHGIRYLHLSQLISSCIALYLGFTQCIYLT